MTRIIVAVVVAFAVPSLAVADCPKGSIEYSGNCYADLQPEKDNTPSVKPSEDKVPSDKMPSYQRVGIVAAMPMPETAESELKKMQMAAHDSKAEAAQR